MHYINPYDLLEITAENLSDVSSAAIKKAKQKLLAEIELSDTNSIIHAGIEVNKSDCLRAIDDLDNRDKKEFHFFIYQHKHLKRFLTKGKLSFFENYQTESIYKLPEFLEFISQFFAEQYDKILLENYKQWNQEAVAKIISVKPITNEAYFEKCYKSTYAYVKEIDTEINGIIKDITNNKSPFISKKFSGLDNALIEKVNVPLLNLLPIYFQSLRNQLALSIRNLARDINNEPHLLYEPAFKVIDIANNISTDALTKQTITKGYYTIKKNYDDDLAKLKAQTKVTAETQLISWWQKKASQIETIRKEIEDGEGRFISSNFYSLETVVYEIADPPKLNALSNNFQSIKNQVASEVRSLAVTVNNEPHHKHKIAYDLISIAYNINTDSDVAAKISSAYATIKGNFDKQASQQRETTKSKYDASSQQKTKTETKEPVEEKKSNTNYRIAIAALCASLIWALFSSTILNIVLAIGTLLFAIPVWKYIKKPDEFLQNKPLEIFIFLLTGSLCVGGFFYSPLGIFYVSYHLLSWGQTLFYDVFLNTPYRKERSWGYFIGALFLTLFFMVYENGHSETTEVVPSSENVTTPRDNSSSNTDNSNASTSNSNSNNANRPNSGNLYDPNTADKKTTTSPMDFKIPNYIDVETFREVNPNEKLYGLFVGMKGDGNYSKKYSVFKKRFANESGMLELFRKQTGSGKYSKSFNDFKKEYAYLPLGQDYTLPRSSATSQTTSSADKYQNKKKIEDLTGYEAANYSTGSTPDCFNFTPKYDYSLDNKLEVSVGSTTDVAIKLISYSTGKCIRYVYIRSGATYDITHIPQGKYYTKIAYGTDWRQKIVDGKCIGKFVNNSLYKKGSKVLNFNKIYKGVKTIGDQQYSNYEIPSFSLELSVKSTSFDIDRYDTNNINEDDFNQ